MKTLRTSLFVLAGIFAPLAAQAVTVTITSLPAGIADFHPVSIATGLIFNRDTVSPFSSFEVELGTLYPVFQVILGVNKQVGTVSWAETAPGSGIYVPTYTPAL